ncbi:MAG TPA: SprB repeat-containing protein, partial [Flavobacteriales bacterium]|nr:SprB repeat-containing protein [Flavobacteriales bacterium]
MFNVLRTRLYLLGALLFLWGPDALASDPPTVTLTPSYHGTYNISCFGKKDGAIDLSVSSGTSPYTYTWSNGATTQDISGLAAGYYRVLVRDHDGNETEKEITLVEPGPEVECNSLTLTLLPSDHHGYNISCDGGKDGAIDLTIVDGTPPYTIDWSTSQETEDITDLTAGYYRVSVKDSDGRKGQAEITLTEPQAMKVDIDVYKYPNGYNISCFDCSNGNAAAVVTGGAPPFIYSWSDGPTTTERYNLGPADYGLTVSDANGCDTKEEKIYLQQPDRSDWTMSGNVGTNPSAQYIGTSDDKDVVFKSNGTEQLRLLGTGGIKLSSASLGVGPLYRGEDGVLRAGLPTYPPFNPDPPTLCTLDPTLHMQFWRSDGNTFPAFCPQVQNPVQPRIGTLSDHPLLVITNGLERMRFTTTGKVGIGTSSPSADLHVHHADANTRVLISSSTGSSSVWVQNNAYAYALNVTSTGIGQLLEDANTTTPLMAFKGGRIAIGTDLPAGSSSPYHLYVEGGVATRDVLVKTGDWPDYVFTDAHYLMSLGELRNYVHANHHLPGIPSAGELEEEGGVELGDMQRKLLQVLEE